MPTPHQAGLSRRGLLTAGALAGLAVALPTSAAHATMIGPSGSMLSASKMPNVVFWGSSSAAGGSPHQFPAGYQRTSLHDKLSELLGVGVDNAAIGGDASYHTVSIRSTKSPYKPNFYYAGQGGYLPSQGRIIVKTIDGRVPNFRAMAHRLPNWGPGTPGTVAGVPCTIRAVEGRNRKIVIERQNVGSEIKVGAGGGSIWKTALESIHSGKAHLIWTGKNNIGSYSTVIADTRTCFNVAPDSSIVMGHWYAYNDRIGRSSRTAIDKVNASYKAEYGSRYYDAMADLIDPELWAVPEIAPFKIGTSAADKEWLAMGLPPRSIVGTDNMHLNALGNTVMAHGIHRFLTGSAGLY